MGVPALWRGLDTGVVSCDELGSGEWDGLDGSQMPRRQRPG
jgi:hypothetical protein